MKLSRLVIYFLFALLQVNAVFAAPPQRLIIEFDTALNIEQKQTLQQQIQAILKTAITVLPHSTAQRWIIIINPPLDAINLEKANAEISRLTHVKYVEPDQVMGIAR